ncbi:Protein of unknown function [Pyronema omphalodes CBS 100304]|uniref:Uncharacterized protein n=1 Tax=Pyronema omphalodes (strain CBS 100304) TaxID=1076935 RepID=U4LPA7_PYROM|nr:Protein of unknown function [Pyronema omphalodes CBS 100304]
MTASSEPIVGLQSERGRLCTTSRAHFVGRLKTRDLITNIPMSTPSNRIKFIYHIPSRMLIASRVDQVTNPWDRYPRVPMEISEIQSIIANQRYRIKSASI